MASVAAYGRLPGWSVEGACLNASNNHWPHDDQVSQQFYRAALLRRWPIVELLAVDLAREMEQNPHFVLQGCDEFVLPSIPLLLKPP